MKHKNETVKQKKFTGEKQTAFVVTFSAITMVLEIFVGLFSHSMALLANGIHMGSHVLAVGLSMGGPLRGPPPGCVAVGLRGCWGWGWKNRAGVRRGFCWGLWR